MPGSNNTFLPANCPSQEELVSRLKEAIILLQSDYFQKQILHGHETKESIEKTKKIMHQRTDSLTALMEEISASEASTSQDINRLVKKYQETLEEMAQLYKLRDTFLCHNTHAEKHMVSRQASRFLKAFSAYGEHNLEGLYHSKEDLAYAFRLRHTLVPQYERLWRQASEGAKNFPWWQAFLWSAVLGIAVLIPISAANPGATSSVVAAIAVSTFGIAKAVVGFLIYNLFLDNLIHILVLAPIGLFASSLVLGCQKLWEKATGKDKPVPYQKFLEEYAKSEKGEMPEKELTLLSEYIKARLKDGTLNADGSMTHMDRGKFLNLVLFSTDKEMVTLRNNLRLKALDPLRQGATRQDYGYERETLITQTRKLLTILHDEQWQKLLHKHECYYKQNMTLPSLRAGLIDFLVLLEDHKDLSQHDIHLLLQHGKTNHKGKPLDKDDPLGFYQVILDAGYLLKTYGQAKAQDHKHISPDYRDFADAFDKEGFLMGKPTQDTEKLAHYYKGEEGVESHTHFHTETSEWVIGGIAAGAFLLSIYGVLGKSMQAFAEALASVPERLLGLIHLGGLWESLGEGSKAASITLTAAEYYNAVENSLHGIIAFGPALYQAQNRSFLPDLLQDVANATGYYGQKWGLIKETPLPSASEEAPLPTSMEMPKTSGLPPQSVQASSLNPEHFRRSHFQETAMLAAGT